MVMGCHGPMDCLCPYGFFEAQHVTFSKWGIQSLHLEGYMKGRNMAQCSATPCELRPPEFHFSHFLYIFLIIPHLS